MIRRAEVSGRVDGVAGWPSQGEPDSEHQQAHKERAEPGGRRVGIREERQDAEHQDERPDDLADDVGHRVADRGRRAEAGQLEPGILGRRPSGAGRPATPASRRRTRRRTHRRGTWAHRSQSVSPITAKPSVTAGLRCAPLNCPTAKTATMTPMPQPNVMTIQPAFSALEWLSKHPGHDPVTQQDQDRGPDHLSSEDAQEPLLPLRGIAGSGAEPIPVLPRLSMAGGNCPPVDEKSDLTLCC